MTFFNEVQKKLEGKSKTECVAFAVRCAESVLPIWETKFPNDARPRQAIEAAKTWNAKPTKYNRDACESAIRSADSAVWSVARFAWTAPQFSDRSAEFVASSAESTAWSALSTEPVAWAAWSAEYAARAAPNRAAKERKIMGWLE